VNAEFAATAFGGALTPERTKAARLALEVYVGLIPTDADALIGLADLLVSDYLNRWNEAENDPAAGKHLLQEAEIRLNQAAAIDNSLPEIHYVRGLCLSDFEGRRDVSLFGFVLVRGCHARRSST
jgi:hypothetical protein